VTFIRLVYTDEQGRKHPYYFDVARIVAIIDKTTYEKPFCDIYMSGVVNVFHVPATAEYVWALIKEALDAESSV
jgi:hypothetical protein